MASLTTTLTNLRAALQTATSTTVEFDDALAIDATTGVVQFPATESIVVLMILPSTAENFFGDDVNMFAELLLQVEAWAKTTTAALALYQLTHAALMGRNHDFLGIGPKDRAGEFVGIKGTYRLTAAFDSF